MATPTAREKFFEAINESYDALLSAVEATEARGHNVVVKAQVPFAEMLSYANDLVSMTQGRASYHMEFGHYDYVPNEIAETVIAHAKAARGAVPAEDEEVA